MATFEWHTACELPELQVRQVYCWLFDKNSNVLIVSKDGQNWQLPGGTPEEDEESADTLVRELSEETGLVLDLGRNKPMFIGFYVVTEAQKLPFLQLRYKLVLSADFEETALEPAPEDDIKYIKSVPITDISQYLPWVSDTGELKAATI